MKSGLHSVRMPATRIMSVSTAASSEVFFFNMVSGDRTLLSLLSYSGNNNPGCKTALTGELNSVASGRPSRGSTSWSPARSWWGEGDWARFSWSCSCIFWLSRECSSGRSGLV